MAHPAYSVRFIAGETNSIPTASALSYTVPVGKVAVVRSVDMLVTGVGTVFFGLYHPAYALWVSTVGVPYHNVRSWEGRHVVTAGGRIGVGWYSGSSMVIASGYLLNA